MGFGICERFCNQPPGLLRVDQITMKRGWCCGLVGKVVLMAPSSLWAVALLLIQLLANAHGKAGEVGRSVWNTRWSSWLQPDPVLDVPTIWEWSNRWNMSVSLSLCVFLVTLPFKWIKKKIVIIIQCDASFLISWIVWAKFWWCCSYTSLNYFHQIVLSTFILTCMFLCLKIITFWILKYENVTSTIA